MTMASTARFLLRYSRALVRIPRTLGGCCRDDRNVDRPLGPDDETRAARREVEAALDSLGWPWRPGVSRWLDVLVIVEEASRS